MKIRILGTNGPYPAANGATTAILVKSESGNILLDCGSGALARLQKHIKLQQLSACVLSHLHLDHCSEVKLLAYAYQILIKNGCAKPLDVFCPASPQDVFSLIKQDNSLNVTAIDGENVLQMGGIKITFCQMQHNVESYAIKCEQNGKILVFSSDTAANYKLIEFSKNADVLIINTPYRNAAKPPEAMHMTAYQAGKTALAANAKKLILSHFLPGSKTKALSLEATRVFKNTEIASEKKEYSV